MVGETWEKRKVSKKESDQLLFAAGRLPTWRKTEIFIEFGVISY